MVDKMKGRTNVSFLVQSNEGSIVSHVLTVSIIDSSLAKTRDRLEFSNNFSFIASSKDCQESHMIYEQCFL